MQTSELACAIELWNAHQERRTCTRARGKVQSVDGTKLRISDVSAPGVLEECFFLASVTDAIHQSGDS